jgi:hypothetical protein
MVSKKALLDNELMREIIRIRYDTLQRMLTRRTMGLLPGTTEEGATGKYDNKGAILIPGGLIYQDVDEKFIRYQSHGQLSSAMFREQLLGAMQTDNATLLYPDGVAAGINLDGGFFSKAARRILTYKRAAYRRVKKIGNHIPIEISSEAIIKSHCPTYMKPPYGARTRISSCIAVGLIDPPMFYAYNRMELNLTSKQAKRLTLDIDCAREPVRASDGPTLYPPYIVVCHTTRHRENAYAGLTRILGIGAFGEFATFSFEELNRQLHNELKRRKITIKPDDCFAQCRDHPILGILRIYHRTNPGKRSINYTLHLVSPVEDAGFDPHHCEECPAEPAPYEAAFMN